MARIFDRNHLNPDVCCFRCKCRFSHRHNCCTQRYHIWIGQKTLRPRISVHWCLSRMQPTLFAHYLRHSKRVGFNVVKSLHAPILGLMPWHKRFQKLAKLSSFLDCREILSIRRHFVNPVCQKTLDPVSSG